MPSRSSVSACSASRGSASSPACTPGCSVLTRPPSTSGKPVTSSTAVTGTPASAIRAAVDPVDTSCTPASCSPRASSVRPVLSDTLTSARRTGIRAVGPAVAEGAVTVGSSFEQAADRVDVAAASPPPGCGRAGWPRRRPAGPRPAPGRAPARCPPLVDAVDRHPGGRHAGGQRVAHRVRAGEVGQQRGMGVDDPEAADHGRRQHPHEAGQHDQVRLPLGQRGRDLRVPPGPVGEVGQRPGERRHPGRGRPVAAPGSPAGRCRPRRRSRRGSPRRPRRARPAACCPRRRRGRPVGRTRGEA